MAGAMRAAVHTPEPATRGIHDARYEAFLRLQALGAELRTI